jgi:FAD/FMN-containing dehydrogenase/Fe-S oxidoreductase
MSLTTQAPTSPRKLDALERELRARIRGEVRFDEGSRALYSTDASNYRQVPLGVVLPKDAEDVVETVAICRRYGAPVLSRGGGTSLAGQTCNVAVVMDMSKYMHHILELDPEKRLARVQPGLILDHLRHAAEQYGLTFGPDPSTHNRCTLGGMIGNNSCGVHAQMAGKTADNIAEMEILTYDGLRMRVGPTSDEELEQIIRAGGRRGEIYAGLKRLRDTYADLIRQRFPRIPRLVSGYNLDQLLPEQGFHVARALVGTEGTCATVLEATTQLVASPPARVLVVLGYPDLYCGCDQIPFMLNYNPIGLEGFDDGLINDVKRKGLYPEAVPLLPEGGGWLMAEFGADTKKNALEQAHAFMRDIQKQNPAPQIRLFEDTEQMEQIWAVRESALGATAIVPGEKPTWPGWEDSAAPPERFGDYLRELRALIDSYHYRACFYGHFGQGCLHTRMDYDFQTPEGIATFRAFMNDAADLVIKYGGSLSGEHGDGQARAELLPKLFGEELIEAFREFKRIWDPEGRMNPGKVIDSYRMDENLRLGTGYHPRPVGTYFQFPEDEGSFAQAALRCVGVGKCRRMEGGTMCPSYMVTREEADSTRGRARLLFEMLQGDPLEHGWRSKPVREALDLCLACKGCKGECPVNVDMATYKAEFLAHYYKGRPRPRSAYSMGLIYWWARAAALLPTGANFVTHAPLLGNLAKRVAGVAPQRQMPAFAQRTFKQWFRHRLTRNQGRPHVILWPDTFNNHFLPETAMAAVGVLEAAGFQVVVPRRSLCCGRPLYDFGFLNLAKRLLEQVLTTLDPELKAGACLVVLEPSCASVFRDELLNLFPHDPRAKRLASATYLLSEFLEKCAPHYTPPRLERKAVVHGHCHHKAIMKMGAERQVLKKLGLDFKMPDTGCCGMAGAFGFEEEHYEVSLKVGERVLLPAVRKAEPETLVIADGFSCREQIAQTTGRQALHLAQVIHLAMQEQQDGPSSAYPESAYLRHMDEQLRGSRARRSPVPLVSIGLAALLALLIQLIRKRFRRA